MSIFTGIFFQKGRLSHEFDEEVEPIGFGAYSIVTKAKHNVDDKEYAIKKIRVKDENDHDTTIKERKIWAKLDCDYFVQYRSSWVEKSDNRIINQFRSHPMASSLDPNDSYAVLHIQMDLCTFSLNEVLEQMKVYFKIKPKEPLTQLAYYILSELLLEILECIKYLHEMEPQILHRDIKPTNILIKWNRNKFIKISDFGLSKEHERPDQSHSRFVGTFKYMAPEVKNSTRYDASADVYSIAILVQEMFNFNINDNLKDEKYKALCRITADSMSGSQKTRPKCKEWLEKRDQWSLRLDAVRGLIMREIDVNKDYDINKEFVMFFLKTKYSQ